MFTKEDRKPRDIPAQVHFPVPDAKKSLGVAGKRFEFPLKGNPAVEPYRAYTEQTLFNAIFGVFDFEADNRAYAAFRRGDENAVKAELRLCRNRGGDERPNFIDPEKVWPVEKARKAGKLWERSIKLVQDKRTRLYATRIYEAAAREQFPQGRPMPEGEAFKVRRVVKKKRKGTVI